MKRKVYIETSVISYLTAWRSRDLVIAGNQETTREWWDRKNEFDVFISQFVLGKKEKRKKGARLALEADEFIVMSARLNH